MQNSKTALVVGGTSGIGLAITELLAANKWTVVAAGHVDVPGLHGQLPATVSMTVADITAPGTTDDLISRVVADHGSVDLVVNSAGIHALADVSALTDDSLLSIIGLNLVAATQLARAAVLAMKESGGGVIINIGSEAGLVAVPGQVAYNVSKAGVSMLTKSIAVDHAHDHIRAVTVCPGTTLTPLVDAAIQAAADPAAHERMLAETRPAGRLGKPAEIAAAVLFAATNDYMTGCDLVIDGGYTAK